MFVRKNPNLNYPDIEQRIASDLSALTRTPEAPTTVPRPWDATAERPESPENGMLRYRTKRRSLLNKVGAWFKSLAKVYKTRDQAILSLKLAAQAEDRVSTIEARLNALNGRLGEIATLGARLEDQVRLAEQHSHDALEQAFCFDDSSKQRLSHLEEANRKQIDRLEEAIRQHLSRQEETSRNDAARLESDNKQRLEYIVGQLNAVQEQAGKLKNEIMFQQLRLTQIALSARESKPATEQSSGFATVADQRLDSFYAAFEDVFRGERSEIKSRFVKYVDRLKLAGAGQLGKPVLDIGCGRGEWLELLKDNNIPAYGIDLNGVMVERTVSCGLDARHVEAVAHLKGVADGALSAVTAFHVVEHISLDVLISLLDEALRALIPGGLILLETPNPETVRVGATTFYNDPTHRNPILPPVLKFVVEHRGFQMAEIVRLHPFTDGLLQEPTADAALLNQVLFGSQDYAVIARRL